MKEGICVAGNDILDIPFSIETYPGKSELTTITESMNRTTGGALYTIN